METGRAAIEVQYAGAIVTAEGITAPARAVTYNRSGGRYNETIAIVRMADGLGRELQVKTQAQVEGKYGFTVSGARVYDAQGRVVAEGKPAFEEGNSFEYSPVALKYPTTYQYDCMGRKIEATYPDGGIVVAAYGTRDGKLIECITDQNGNSKLITRDVRGNIVAVTEEGGITTTYRYDVVNQLVTVVDAAGNVTSITYDTWGRRTSIDNPDTGKTIYQYDDAGNLIRKQTANLRKQNKWINYVYNYKQVKMIDNPDSEDVYYEYGRPGDGKNGAGRVVQEKTGKLVDSYWYGALGEVITKERSIDGKTYRIQWKWDNFGRVRSIIYSNNFSVYYAYDAGGQVKGVVGYLGAIRTDYVKDIQYDEYGSRTRVEYGNGVVSTYEYDDRMHRLVQLQTKQGDSTLQNIAYSYDRVGNILTRTENGIQMSDRTPKTITHRYSYDSLYRLVEAEGTLQENGNVVNNYRNAFTYSEIGNILSKLQIVKAQGNEDPTLTYTYTYTYAGNKPHAVTGINDNLTYRYDANGNMTAVYDTAKNYNRILYWDDDNRLTKTVDTQAGVSTATQYAYDAKGMRIVKDGPYGKSIYVDTGYVLSQEYVESNHIFVGNTRVASVVKHRDETKAATYYYATDHLGSSSVLTNNIGAYHERIEYLPYGEVWVEDTVNSNGYTTPYKFTGKELDKETGLYYFGARYYDARISRWISTDPALQEGKYFPKLNNYDTEHDFYWYLQQDGSRKLAGMGGVFNAINMDVYHYAGNNPVQLTDPDGNMAFFWHFILTFSEARNAGVGFLDSLKMAWHAMAWDFRGTQSTTDEYMVNSHAMIRGSITNEAGKIVREQQTIEEAAQGTEKFIKEKVKEGTIRSIGEAAHAAVDKATESHKEQVWTGELTWEHIKKDTFPSKEAIKEARRNIQEVLQEAFKINPDLKSIK
ncbi:MAG TPA: RHS repeat-associated core domain-containing protein [Spirochaetota bacterium]|nr:RHS repeat-associated core domain-containing protein [Spirochaetota bacterium]